MAHRSQGCSCVDSPPWVAPCCSSVRLPRGNPPTQAVGQQQAHEPIGPCTCLCTLSRLNCASDRTGAQPQSVGNL